MINFGSLNGQEQVRYYQNRPQARVVALDLKKEYADEAHESRKIGFGEGIGLLAKGVFKQVKDVVGAIFEHPIRTLAVVGATSVGLMALPLIGIPTAVGGAAMALGFAGLAVFNGAKHTMQFLKNNSNGEYDKARENLEQIGGDSVDLALSAPFVPKALKEIKRFAKYGKIGYNADMAAKVVNAKGLKGKFSALQEANKEAARAVNFNEATEIELAKLNGITDAEKLKIKQYIKDYNVPKDKIPEVVLEQWAQERGVHTKPALRYQSLKETTLGYATPSECRITLNDFGDDIVKVNTNCNTEQYKQVGLARYKNPKQLEVTFQDVTTGEVFTETIDRSIVETRNKLLVDSNKCSKEAQQILTTAHEREHIDQYARFYMNGDRIAGVTPEAEALYRQMAREIKPMTPQEADMYRQMVRYNPKRKTVVAYTANPMEIQARSKEIELLAQERFQTLDKVFKQTNTMSTPDISKADIALNVLRAQSAVS